MTTLYAGGKPEFDAPVSDVTEEQRMATLIESLSSYIEYYHGGSLELVDFDGETLRVRMAGACHGCSLAPVTLHGWVEGTVRPFFPNLKTVVSVA